MSYVGMAVIRFLIGLVARALLLGEISCPLITTGLRTRFARLPLV